MRLIEQDEGERPLMVTSEMVSKFARDTKRDQRDQRERRAALRREAKRLENFKKSCAETRERNRVYQERKQMLEKIQLMAITGELGAEAQAEAQEGEEIVEREACEAKGAH